MWQDHPECQRLGAGRWWQRVAFDGDRVWAAPGLAGTSRNNWAGMLPRLRGWCHWPSERVFLSALDPDSRKGGNPGDGSACSQPRLAGPQQSLRVWPAQGSGSAGTPLPLPLGLSSTGKAQRRERPAD